MDMPQSPSIEKNGLFFFAVGVGVLLAGMLFVLISTPIHDPDLWWHLATGRHFFESGSLLTEDPFGLAGADISPDRRGILNAYLLAQTAMYACHLLAGEWGTIVLFALLLAAVPASLLLYGAFRKVRPWALLTVSALCGWTLLYFSGARPNLFTILFTPLLVLLFDSIGFFRKGNLPYRPPYNLRVAVLVIPFMLLWANLHGGFLIGSALITLYLLGETAKRAILRRPIPLRPLAALWGLLGTAVLATLCNPNGTALYRGLAAFEGSIIQQKTSEYASPFLLAGDGKIAYPYFLLAALLLTLLVVQWRRTDLTEAGIALFLFAISCTALRYVPLFAGGVTLFTARLLADASDSRPRLAMALPAFALLALASTFAWAGLPHIRGQAPTSFASPLQPGKFPQRAYDFIEGKGIGGNLFNHFNWGGYLAWRGTPDVKTFIDGRSLNETIFHAYTRVLWLPEEAQEILDRYGVNVIVMPRLNPFTGEFYALNDFLYRSPTWMLVYRDETAMVLTRRGTFKSFPDLAALPKRLIYQDALLDADRRLRFGETPIHLLNARATTLQRLKQLRP